MKGVYVYNSLECDCIHAGIEKKICDQITLFNRMGLVCRRIPNRDCKPFTLLWRVLMRLPLCPVCNDVMNTYLSDFDGLDFVYIRRRFISLQRFLTIRKIRKRNPNTKILYEIPTYPFKKELTQRWVNYPLWWKECVYKKLLKRYIDRVVVVGNYENIDGIKAIPIVNGIDINGMTPIHPAPEDGSIHIMAIANIEWWHGYDRFIKGLSQYYQSGGQRMIVLHLVGTGPTVPLLANQINKLGLNNYVIMHGYKSGDELDEIYNCCHLGLISLATQDKDVYVHSTLKSRDYLAKGLPTMSTGMTDVFIGVDYKYNLELPMDAEIVDMNLVIDFYDKIYGSMTREEVIAEIRAFAERTVDINITMAPVVRYLKGEG